MVTGYRREIRFSHGRARWGHPGVRPYGRARAPARPQGGCAGPASSAGTFSMAAAKIAPK